MNINWKLLIPTVLIFSFLAGCAPTVEEPTAENTPSVEEPTAGNTPPTATSEMQEEDTPTSVPPTTEEIFPDPLVGRIPVIYSYTAEYLVACCQDECGQMRTAEREKDIR